jgi:hypothetical protein
MQHSQFHHQQLRFSGYVTLLSPTVIQIFIFADQSAYYCPHHAKYIEAVNNGEQFHTKEYEEANKINQQIIADMNNEGMCNVYRNELGNDQKNRSFGLLVTFLSCNVIIGFTESIKSEGCRRITVNIIHDLSFEIECR